MSDKVGEKQEAIMNLIDQQIKGALKDQASRLEILQDRIKDAIEVDTTEHSQGIKQVMLFVTKAHVQAWINSLKHQIDIAGDCEICDLEKILGEESLEIAEAVKVALSNRNEETRSRVLRELLDKTTTKIESLSVRVSPAPQP
jgi:ATPase subunit of ABC transporter with duplicated ATPase domains